MSPQTVLGLASFAREDIQLASLIPDIKDIDLDSLESALPLESDDFTVRDVDDFTGFFNGHSDYSFQGFLAQIASWTTQRSTDTNTTLTAHRGRIYTLRKPNLWFRRLCEQGDVREWLQEQIEDGNDTAYFVVGLHTLFDAASSEGLALASEHHGAIAVPIADSNSPFVAASGAGQVGLSAGLERSRNTAHSCTLPGEQVFAVRLRRVILRTWRTQDISKVQLAQHSHWVMASDNRAADEGDSEVLEAFLEGGSSEGDGLANEMEDIADRYYYVVLH
ncbi:hypothetical protein BJX99DRAFT_61974 [Aspergillus californicus]